VCAVCRVTLQLICLPAFVAGSTVGTMSKIGKQIRSTWIVLKCGAGEGWRRSVGSIVWEM